MRTLLALLRGGPAGARPAEAADPLARALFDGSPCGLLVCDAEGCVLRVNRALRRMSQAAFPGRPGASVFAAAGREATWDGLAPVLAGQAPFREIDLAWLAGAHGEGDGWPVSVAATALRGGGGPPSGGASGALLAFTDLAPLRRAQEQLDASQQLHAVGRLTSGIAHDFNNLLTIVTGASTAVLARAGVDEETREDVQLIEAAGARGALLVGHMLRLGRGEAPQPRAVALNEAARTIASLLRRTIGGAIRLELDLEEPGAAVRIEPAQLDQVLINLLLNARDAMPGRGRILLRTGSAVLSAPRASPGGDIPAGRYAVVEVRDEGAGIDAAVLPRIFEPFFTTRPGEGGHGLGLSMVQRIVRAAGGWIGVDSQPGAFASFTLYLPPLPASPAGAPAGPGPRAPAARPAGGPGRTVLLVDDEDLVRRLAARALRESGWTVLESESGDAALERDPAELAGIDAVVSDVAMPGLDGPALVARLREGRPGLPAILVSGYSPRARPAQGVAFLMKPYALADLAAALERAVEQAPERAPAVT